MISVLSKVTLGDNMSCTFVMNLKLHKKFKIKTEVKINSFGFKFRIKMFVTVFIQSKIPLVSTKCFRQDRGFVFLLA